VNGSRASGMRAEISAAGDGRALEDDEREVALLDRRRRRRELIRYANEHGWRHLYEDVFYEHVFGDEKEQS
jgi:hypothetical protein